MMKFNYLIITLFGLFSFVSCIQEEAPNAEADIVAVDSIWVKNARESGLLLGDPIVENREIVFMVKDKNANLTHLAPLFVLTPGATISPAKGVELDFTTPQIYMVTSADGNLIKEYKVSFIYLGALSKSNFEHWEYDGREPQYMKVYDITSKGYIPWVSGNSGFALTGAAKSSEDYPT